MSVCKHTGRCWCPECISKMGEENTALLGELAYAFWLLTEIYPIVDPPTQALIRIFFEKNAQRLRPQQGHYQP